MASNPVVNSLVFSGSVAGQASIQAQGIAGGLTFLLPNLVPVQGQLLNVVSVNGNNVFLGFTAAQGADLGDVTSVFGRSGVVVATSGDYSVGQVTGAAPLASPALTGTPTAPTAAALDNSTKIATTAYADAAVAVEASRATTAEGLLVPKTTTVNGHALSSNVTVAFADLGGSLAISQINSKQGNGNAVQLTNTGATVAGDVVTYDANSNVVDSGTLLSSLASNASVALKANIASPTFTGVPAAPTASALTSSTQIATTAYADSAVGVETSRATAAEALLAPKASPTFTGTVTTAAISATSISASSFVAVTGNLDLSSGHGHIVQNTDIAGTITVNTGAPSGSYSILGTYASAPIVVASPTSDPAAAGATSWWVSSTTSAITINVAGTTSGPLVFNYIALGN